MNVVILYKKHTIFFVSLAKNSLIPNKEIGEKLLFYSYKSIG